MACDQPKFRSRIGVLRLLAPLVARDDTLEEMQCARDSDEARTAPEQDDILKEGGQSQPESCRDAGGNSGCRAYGTRAHCATYPALKRWAILFRAYGAGSRAIHMTPTKWDMDSKQQLPSAGNRRQQRGTDDAEDQPPDRAVFYCPDFS